LKIFYRGYANGVLWTIYLAEMAYLAILRVYNGGYFFILVEPKNIHGACINACSATDA
jgi:hypothetical protein